MNSNFGFNNGMTIQIPAFNAANDQLFLAIKTYFDSRFNELLEHIQQIQSTNDKLISNTKKIDSEIVNLKLKTIDKNSINRTKNKFKSNLKKSIFKYSKLKERNSIITKKEAEEEDEIESEKSPKRESIDHCFVGGENEILETNSFLLGIGAKIDGENDTKFEQETTTPKNCDSVFDNIIEKYLKVNEPKQIFKDILEPIVVLNPAEKKEIFIGGNENVRLPLWAYKKCLTCIRGKPSELSSRLCLRLLQSKFGRKYMLTHNYNGSGDKVPIDRQIMSSILVQAKMQFPDQEDFQNNPARFAMFRDYINNAFRVVAYRHRKGIQSNTPFWDQNGEPITDLDPPSWIADHNN